MNKSLSETDPLTLMISSRCSDEISYQGKLQSLEALRKDLKAKLEKITIGGKQVFKVWIHEDESNAGALINNWDECLEKARDVDVFIVLYNGRAGWVGDDNQVRNGLGICHAELSAAYNSSPAKVRSIHFKALVPAEKGSPDETFQAYVRKGKFPAAQVNNGEEALQRAEELAAAIMLSLARAGVGVNSSGNYYAGEALEWSRLNFQGRREVMTAAMVELLREKAGGPEEQSSPNVVIVKIQNSKIGFVCDSVPSSMSTPAARELVGQPFLDDHLHAAEWGSDICGPVHVIACQKNVTETQAIRQLGFPDAVVVSTPFGVYVADDVQKIQMAFVGNCRDRTTTREKVQSFLNWLNEHGEAQYLVRRAEQRRRIATVIETIRNEETPQASKKKPAGSQQKKL